MAGPPTGSVGSVLSTASWTQPAKSSSSSKHIYFSYNCFSLLKNSLMTRRVHRDRLINHLIGLLPKRLHAVPVFTTSKHPRGNESKLGQLADSTRNTARNQPFPPSKEGAAWVTLKHLSGPRERRERPGTSATQQEDLSLEAVPSLQDVMCTPGFTMSHQRLFLNFYTSKILP